MKNKKWFIFALGLILAIVILLIVLIFVKDKFDKDKMVNIINNNSNLPFNYLSKLNDNKTALEKYERTNNYMNIYYSYMGTVLSYYGYPNDESELCLGEIVLSNNTYNILGVTIGDNIDESISKIEKYGFKQDKEMSRIGTITLKYKVFTITIERDYESYKDQIKTIKLNAESKYLGNKVY